MHIIQRQMNGQRSAEMEVREQAPPCPSVTKNMLPEDVFLMTLG